MLVQWDLSIIQTPLGHILPWDRTLECVPSVVIVRCPHFWGCKLQHFGAAKGVLVEVSWVPERCSTVYNVKYLPQNADKDGEDLEVDYAFFDEHVWPILAHRVPAFEALKVLILLYLSLHHTCTRGYLVFNVIMNTH